ncbi:MAG: hypothetical protein GX982_06045, partial [Tissierellia bacterium]|nr:hypothetical protein [Tissierellia bacterium]
MKKINKTFSLILAMVLVLSAVMPAFASEGDKVSLDSVVVKLDDGRLVKVNLEDYALAFLMENDLFDFLRGDKPEPEIIYVSSADKYIDLEEYATNFMFNGGNEEEAINDAEAISEEIVNTFFVFKDFDEAGEPILEPIVESSDDVAEKVEEIQTLIAGLPEVEEVDEENKEEIEEIKAKIQEIETLILELIELDEDYPVETLDGYEEKYLAIAKRIDEIENPIIIKVVDVSAINGKVTVEFNKEVTEVPEGLVVLKDGEALELEA